MEYRKLYTKNRILGIELLKALLCLWVVIIHCWNSTNKIVKYLRRGFHVPTFFMISFYFFYPILSERKRVKIIFRFQRLIIPYIIWPIVIFSLNNILMKNISFGQFKSKISFKELYLQLIFGARFHWIFWYQFNLIFLSLIFTIISYIFKNNLLVILDFIAVMSLYLNVSLLLYNTLVNFKKYIFTTIGTLIELAPLGVIGCHYNSLNLLSKIQNISLYFRLILLVLIYIFFKFDIFIILPGFRYSSILLNLLASSILFIFFNSFTFRKNSIISFFLSHITKFTGGI